MPLKIQTTQDTYTIQDTYYSRYRPLKIQASQDTLFNTQAVFKLQATQDTGYQRYIHYSRYRQYSRYRPLKIQATHDTDITQDTDRT